MAVSVQKHKARIDPFSRSNWPNKSRGDGHGKENNTSMKLWFSGLILSILLGGGGGGGVKKTQDHTV
jgi:hypothetical protein